MTTVQESAGDGFHTIEMGDLDPGTSTASEPQLTHTPYDPESLSFVSISSPEDTEVTSSTIAPSQPASGEAGWGSMPSLRTRPQGRTSQFLESKGFGWLLEVEDEGDEEEKPLL